MANNPSSIRQLLARQGAVWLDYSGDSMMPGLRSNSEILLETADITSAREGDLIAFEVPGRDDIVVHRLIKKITSPRGMSLITKADNYPYLDQEIPEAHLIGRVSKMKKSGRDAAQLLTSDSINSRIYLMLGRILLFARQKKSAIPRVSRAPLEKAFTVCHDLTKKFIK